jgi:hypothetical protein
MWPELWLRACYQFQLGLLARLFNAQSAVYVTNRYEGAGGGQGIDRDKVRL